VPDWFEVRTDDLIDATAAQEALAAERLRKIVAIQFRYRWRVP